MPKGKLILSSNENIEMSGFVSIIQLSEVETLTFTGKDLYLQMKSGSKLTLDNLTISETAEVSEFVSSYARAKEDQTLCKHIVLRSKG